MIMAFNLVLMGTISESEFRTDEAAGTSRPTFITVFLSWPKHAIANYEGKGGREGSVLKSKSVHCFSIAK